MWAHLQLPADVVSITKEILNEKLHFLCSVEDIEIKLRLSALKSLHAKWLVDLYNC